MTKIWVVLKETGAYSDRDVQAVAAFKKEATAQSAVERLDAAASEEWIQEHPSHVHVKTMHRWGQEEPGYGSLEHAISWGHIATHHIEPIDLT